MTLALDVVNGKVTGSVSKNTNYLINNDKLEGVCLENGQKIQASCVFLAVGYIPNSELFIGKKISEVNDILKNYYNMIEESEGANIILKPSNKTCLPDTLKVYLPACTVI